MVVILENHLEIPQKVKHKSNIIYVFYVHRICMTQQINIQVYITQEKLKHMSNQTLVQHCSKQGSTDKTNV